VPGVSGLGPARPPARLHESFRMASRALHTADSRRMTGVCEFGRLGLLPAILSDEAIGDALHRRYLAPLGDTEFAAEIVETLRAYLLHEMHVPRTAQVLCVHPNTVRYRIAKFENLTGVAFRRNRTAAFEVLWALEHRAVADARPATAARARAG
jgi:DNA-binding PucR family transcriptional regulator